MKSKTKTKQVLENKFADSATLSLCTSKLRTKDRCANNKVKESK